MARIEGSSGSLAEVESSSLAQRVTQRPMKAIAWNSLAAPTGLLSGIVAGGRIFSLRNTSSNLILIRGVELGFMTTTAFTAAQALDYALYVARSFSASDSVGTDVSPTGNVGKHRTSLATPSIAARISAAAVISGGTLVQDAVAVGLVAGGSTGLGTGLVQSPGNLFTAIPGEMPLVLAANEGITITNVTLMGAAGVVKAYVALEYAEIAVADYVS